MQYYLNEFVKIVWKGRQISVIVNDPKFRSLYCFLLGMPSFNGAHLFTRTLLPMHFLHPSNGFRGKKWFNAVFLSLFSYRRCCLWWLLSYCYCCCISSVVFLFSVVSTVYTCIFAEKHKPCEHKQSFLLYFVLSKRCNEN